MARIEKAMPPISCPELQERVAATDTLRRCFTRTSQLALLVHPGHGVRRGFGNDDMPSDRGDELVEQCGSTDGLFPRLGIGEHKRLSMQTRRRLRDVCNTGDRGPRFHEEIGAELALLREVATRVEACALSARFGVERSL